MKNVEEIRKFRDEMGQTEHIYEPKYGGKDHSGYDTVMLYEVNFEREECFVKGFNISSKLWIDEILEVSKSETPSFAFNNLVSKAAEYIERERSATV